MFEIVIFMSSFETFWEEAIVKLGGGLSLPPRIPPVSATQNSFKM